MSAQRRYAAAGKQLFHGDKLIALRRKGVDCVKRGVHTLGVNIVQQHDVAVLRVFDNGVRDEIGIVGAPVLRVDRPVD